MLDVSIAKAGFTGVPTIFVSQIGSGSWTTKGTHAVYNASPNGFRVYAYNEYLGAQTYAAYANQKNHCLSWIAIGN